MIQSPEKYTFLKTHCHCLSTFNLTKNYFYKFSLILVFAIHMFRNFHVDPKMCHYSPRWFNFSNIGNVSFKGCTIVHNIRLKTPCRRYCIVLSFLLQMVYTILYMGLTFLISTITVVYQFHKYCERVKRLSKSTSDRPICCNL